MGEHPQQVSFGKAHIAALAAESISSPPQVSLRGKLLQTRMYGCRTTAQYYWLPLRSAMGWFPWHPELVQEPPSTLPLLTGQPARWRSLSERFSTARYDKPVLFLDGLGNDLEAADIKQGSLAANCWLLSAISCLTEFPDAVPILFADRGRLTGDTTKVNHPQQRLHARC
jgi:hypothetical protein